MKYYHGSHKKIENDKYLSPKNNNDGYTSIEETKRIEDLLEKYKPEGAISRRNCLFLSDNTEEIDNLGGYTDFIYEISVENEMIEKSDLSWYSKIYEELENIKENDPISPKVLLMIKNYWAGIESESPSYEYRSTGGLILKEIDNLNQKKNDILIQVSESHVYGYIQRVHRESYDFEDGDLGERIEEYNYYNYQKYNINDLNLNEWDVDECLVDEYVEKIKKDGINKMPPILISEDDSIIDGIHRLNALYKLGYEDFYMFVGTNEKNLENNIEFKNELIDKDLKIHRISCYFGSIDIMEDAQYSPAENSVSEFLVNEHFRGLGFGDMLLKEALKKYNDLGAQVSSLPSLKVFFNNGFNNGKKDFEKLKKDFEENGKSLFVRKNLNKNKIQLKM